jgi:hypothetical protein
MISSNFWEYDELITPYDDWSEEDKNYFNTCLAARVNPNDRDHEKDLKDLYRVSLINE